MGRPGPRTRSNPESCSKYATAAHPGTPSLTCPFRNATRERQPFDEHTCCEKGSQAAMYLYLWELGLLNRWWLPGLLMMTTFLLSYQEIKNSWKARSFIFKPT